jgi:hypothetical protein
VAGFCCPAIGEEAAAQARQQFSVIAVLAHGHTGAAGSAAFYLWQQPSVRLGFFRSDQAE